MTGGAGAPGASTGDEIQTSMEPFDQRVARGRRTKVALAEAMITLIEDRGSVPTSHQVANQAGCSVRSLFHHFHDVENLLCRAAELQVVRHRALVALLPPHGPAEVRIQATCHQRRELYEAIGPVLRAIQTRVLRPPGINNVLAQQRLRLRRQLVVTLGPELAARGAQAEVTLETLDLTTGWSNWSALRFDTGRSATTAERLMIFAVTHMLQEPGGPSAG